MPRITWLLILIAPLIAAFPLVFEFLTKRYSLFSQTSLIGQAGTSDEGIDLSIPSLFAIADIHGDYPKALAALVHAGVVDSKGDWSAGNATLVGAVDTFHRL